MNRTSCSRKAAKEYLTFDVFIEDWFVTINPLVGSYYLCQSWKPRKLILMATRIQIFSIRGSVDCTPLEKSSVAQGENLLIPAEQQIAVWTPFFKCLTPSFFSTACVFQQAEVSE